MHGDRLAPLRFPEQTTPQMIITVADCYNALHAEAGNDQAPTGMMGWSASQLIHDRGLPREKSLMWQIARLQSIIGNSRAHEAIYYLLVAGGLTALNKAVSYTHLTLPTNREV